MYKIINRCTGILVFINRLYHFAKYFAVLLYNTLLCVCEDDRPDTMYIV